MINNINCRIVIGSASFCRTLFRNEAKNLMLFKSRYFIHAQHGNETEYVINF